MTVELINVCARRGDPLESASAAVVTVEDGVAGDRYTDVSLVEAEEIEAFCNEQHLPVDLACTRRNVVTRGVRLNSLVGKEFLVGTVRLRGVELCDPCGSLGRRLATASLSAPQVVERFMGRGGLRAEVIEGGELRVGDSIVELK
jgi:MOSC domain-containing protein YiiM